MNEQLRLISIEEFMALETEPVEFYRASGDTLCNDCGQTYSSHSMDNEHLTYLSTDIDGNPVPYLHILCNGDLIKT